MWRETVLRLRERAGEIAQLLLGYRPPPPAPARRPGSRLAWLATAGGHGAIETYAAGVMLGLGLSLALVSYSLWTGLVAGGEGGDQDDVGAVGTVFLAILLYLIATGFVVGCRTRRISHAAIVGSVTAILGAGIGYLSLAVMMVTIYGQAWFIALLPSLMPFVAVGFVCGALGGAIALPGAAYRAIRDGLREP